MRASFIAFALLLTAGAARAEAPTPTPAAAAPAKLEPLPLPSPNGKPIAIAAGQRSFRVPQRFAKVEAFYRERFGADKDISFTPGRAEGGTRTLTIASRRVVDTWSKVVLREAEVDTAIDVTPVIRFGPEIIEGRGKPLVQLYIPRSPEAARMANDIDHLVPPK